MDANKNIKILLVDDDTFLLDMYVLKFKKSGLDVDTATSSAPALDKLHNGAVPDILLLDIIMPGQDGLELLETIRKEKLIPKATVIILSNQNDEMDRAVTLGADGYIIKAMSIPSEVVQKVLSIYTEKNKSKK